MPLLIAVLKLPTVLKSIFIVEKQICQNSAVGSLLKQSFNMKSLSI